MGIFQSLANSSQVFRPTCSDATLIFHFIFPKGLTICPSNRIDKNGFDDLRFSFRILIHLFPPSISPLKYTAPLYRPSLRSRNAISTGDSFEEAMLAYRFIASRSIPFSIVLYVASTRGMEIRLCPSSSSKSFILARYLSASKENRRFLTASPEFSSKASDLTVAFASLSVRLSRTKCPEIPFRSIWLADITSCFTGAALSSYFTAPCLTIIL